MGSGNSRNGRVAVSPVGPRPNGIGPAVKDNFIFDRQSRSGRTRLHNPAGQISDTRPPLNASGNFVRTEPMAPRPVVSVVTGNQAEVVRPKETKLAKRAETAKVPREKQSVEEKIVGSPDDLRLLASAVDDFRRCQKAVESDQLMTSASLPYLEQLDVLNGVPRDSRLWEIWISRLNSAGLVPTWMDWWNAAWANGVPLSDGDNSAASRRNFVFVLRLMWSAAATSPAVCDQLVKLGGLAAIVEKMGSQTGFQTESLARYRQRRYFAAGLMGVTLSCLRLSRSAPDNFRSVSGPSALQQLTSSPYEAIRLRSQLCLTAAGDMSAVTEATVRRALELLR